MVKSFNMMYDVQEFIRRRIKPDLTYAEFLSRVSDGRLFLIEFIDDASAEHVILWLRRNNDDPKLSDKDTLTAYNARIFDEYFVPENKQQMQAKVAASFVKIPLAKIVALRLNHRRYNWNSSDRIFYQE